MSRPRARAFVGLGSNMGDRRAHLRFAVESLPDVVAVSNVYETSPVGGPPQGPYLNAVAELRTELPPRQLLLMAKSLEKAAGRTPGAGERFGPRPLDVDVLLVGEEEVRDDDLVVPHPRMWERRFVLAPLSELAPELVTPEALDAAVGDVRNLGRLGGEVI